MIIIQTTKSQKLLVRKISSMEGTSDLGPVSPASPAAEELSRNEDLMREIFIRLPVKLLITLKSVSKYWSSIISDPLFAHHHTLLRNPGSVTASGVFFYDSITKSSQIEYVSLENVPDPFYSPPTVRFPPLTVDSSRARRFTAPSLSFLDTVASGATIKILHSISGLTLCKFTSSLGNSQFKHEYCVCNPTTRSYSIIPQPVLMEPEEVVDFILAFEPSESPYYKIICVKSLTHSYASGCCQIVIYSSENRIWRSTSCRFKGTDNIQFGKPAVYWNGVVHFIKNDLWGYNSTEFDIKEERFTGTNQMIYMSHDYPNTTLRYLGECRGHLYAIYVRIPNQKLVRVFELDKETLIWQFRYLIHLNNILPSYPEIIVETQSEFGVEYAFSVLYIYKGEQEVDTGMVMSIPGKVIYYNFHHQTTKVLCELPTREIDTSHHQCATGFQFVETLAVP